MPDKRKVSSSNLLKPKPGSRCRTFSLKVKRTAHNGNDVGSNPIQFISLNHFLKRLKILNRASSSKGRATRLQRES